MLLLIASLTWHVKSKQPVMLKLFLSELTTRRDTLIDAVTVVNKRVNPFCRQHHWKLFRHNNISQKEL